MFFSIFAEPRSDGPPRGAGDVQQPSAEAAGQAEERQKRPAQGPLIGFFALVWWSFGGRCLSENFLSVCECGLRACVACV